MASRSDMEVDLENSKNSPSNSKRAIRRSTSPFSKHYYPDKNKEFSKQLDLRSILFSPDSQPTSSRTPQRSTPKRSCSQKSKKEDNVVMREIQNTISPTLKSPRRRGRPAKIPTDSPRTQLAKMMQPLEISVESPKTSRKSRKNLFTQNTSASPRKVGRPLGSKRISCSTQNLFTDLEEENKSPKKRGRPRSSSQHSLSKKGLLIKLSPKNDSPKKRGRPRSSSQHSLSKKGLLIKLSPKNDSPKKRGRPRSSSQHSLSKKGLLIKPLLKDTTPKKRGRPPSLNRHSLPNKGRPIKLSPKEVTPKKRGRPPSLNRHSLPNKAILAKPPLKDITPKKRGRPPSASRHSLPSKSLNTELENKSPRKRGRPPSVNLFSSSTQSTPENLDQENASPRKRGRPPSSTKSSPGKPRIVSPFQELRNILNFDEDDESPYKRSRSSSVSSSSSRSSSIRRNRLNESSDSDQQYISFGEEEEEEDIADLLGGLTIDRAKNVDVERFNKFIGWTGIETESSYNVFMQAVHEKIFNMDHVEETLRRGLQKVLSGNEGVLFTLYGKAGSGKRTVINRVFGGEENFNFVELNGRFAKLTEVKKDLKVVEDRLKEEGKPLVFVLYDFDALRLSFANKVLYALTNLLRKKPFFLLLVTEKENAVESLEKRIVSRVGQSFIKCMDHRLKVGDCWKLVHKLVEAGVRACNDQSIKEAFNLSGTPPKHFDRLCNRLPCYSELKLFVKQLADKVFDSIESKSACSSKKICKELLTVFDDTVNRLKCLTDRMYGLLVAAAVKTMHITKRVPVKSIHQEYLRFLNTKDIKNPFLQLNSEQELLDDVEYLVFQRFWVAKRQNQKIVGISWLEDPLKVLSDKYYVLFNTDLANWAKSAMKDDARLR